MSLIDVLKESLNESSGGVKPYKFDDNVTNEYHMTSGHMRMKRAEILKKNGNLDASAFQQSLAKEHFDKVI